MKRKVNLVGQSTLTVSLPTKWVKENAISKGDELDVSFDREKVVFLRSEHAKEKKEITINTEGFTYLTLSKYIMTLYINGYDKIILLYKDQDISHPKHGSKMSLKTTIKKIIDRLVGAEITAQSSTKTEIECFVTEQNPNLNKIEKRIQYLTKETTDELLAAIGPEFKRFHDVSYDHHDNITKFIVYYLRELIKSNLGEEEKNAAFAFYIFMDQLVDKIRHISEKISKYGCTPKVKQYLTSIFDIFNEQFKMLNQAEILHETVLKRYALKKKIDSEPFTVREYRVLSEALIFLDTINAFSLYIVSKKSGAKQT